jgi:hypothetical protein
MTDIKGGKGLHGPDKQQDALRNGGSNAHGKGDPSKVTPPNEPSRTEHQPRQRGADVRQGVPDDTLRRDDPDLPEGLSRKRMGPLNKDTGRGG